MTFAREARSVSQSPPIHRVTHAAPFTVFATSFVWMKMPELHPTSVQARPPPPHPGNAALPVGR
jgi:hypothetical protein